MTYANHDTCDWSKYMDANERANSKGLERNIDRFRTIQQDFVENGKDWESTAYYQEKWANMIKKHQSHSLPVKKQRRI